MANVPYSTYATTAQPCPMQLCKLSEKRKRFHEALSPPRNQAQLEVQLKSKLDLSRIVRRIAGRSNFSEGRVRTREEISCSVDSHHSIAAESRSIEIRMIEDIEELSPELHREAFAQPEVLEC